MDYFKRDKTKDIYRDIFLDSEDAMLIVNNSAEIIDSNNKFNELIQHDREVLLSVKMFEVTNGDIYSLEELLAIFQKRRDTLSDFSVDSRLVNNEEILSLQILFMGASSENEDKDRICLTFRDMAQKYQMRSLSTHDLITNLPNQKEAFKDIAYYINKSQSANDSFCLLLLSIDNFIGMRAHLGYQATDVLVVQIAKNLQLLVDEVDGSLYQMTRNNFLLLIPNIDTYEEVETFGKTIKTDLTRMLEDHTKNINLTFAIGATLFPNSAIGVECLVNYTCQALFEANQKGDGQTVIDTSKIVTSDDMDESMLHREMQKGLEENQFLLYYQPLFNMSTGKISGAEALVRWNHPERGFISPSLFIPLAKKTGFIVQLGKFIIKQAIKQQKQWEIFNFKDIEIAINITLREIETGGLVAYIEDEFKLHAVKQKLIRFEIPENVAMINTGIAKREFEALKDLGVSLSLDNFGLGQSSVTCLRSLPLDALKIDYSFILDIVDNLEHQKIVKTMIELGHNFDLNVVASGIENAKIYALLKSYGCDTAQGFYLSKPLPAFEFQEMIRDDVNIEVRSNKKIRDKENSIDEYHGLYGKKPVDEIKKIDKYSDYNKNMF